MIFVGSDHIVEGVVANTEPMTLDPRTVGTPSQYVIEVNAGYTAKHGIQAGTRVRFENLPPIGTPPP
jgi:uncharacterized membrane protein (UPF0127 family)